MTKRQLHAYGLLHAAPHERSTANARARDPDAQLRIYLRNAATLGASLRLQGTDFTLLTNDSSRVEKLARDDRLNIDLATIPFTTEVPSGTAFFSAHFKVDVFRFFASLPEEIYPLFCDLDMLCLREAPSVLETAVDEGWPLYYDLTDQRAPVFGLSRLINDLQQLHGHASEGRWIGGEFLGGTPGFFVQLLDEVERLFPRYVAALPFMHHVGDETLTSAALEVLRRRNMRMVEAGSLGLVGRYWHFPTRHAQRPFRHFRQAWLLHLPLDKPFLAQPRLQQAKSFATIQQLLMRHHRNPVRRIKAKLRATLSRQKCS